MLMKIRKGVFETNSSSTHSIALCKKNNGRVKSIKEAMEEDKDLVVKNGIIVIQDSDELEFGWGFEIYNTFYGRLKYAIASMCPYEDRMTEIIEAVRENFPEITGIQLPVEADGTASVGYIDHQSCGTYQEFMDDYDGTLADYLVDKNIIVVIDNDNSDNFGYLTNSGLFDTEAFANSDTLKEEYVIDNEEMVDVDRNGREINNE